MAEFPGFEEIEDDEPFNEIAELDMPLYEDIYEPINIAGQERRGTERIGSPVLGAKTRARLVAARSAQLQLGVQPLITVTPSRPSELQEIASRELEAARQGLIVFPIRIIRRFPDGTFEYWRVNEFKYFVNAPGVRAQGTRSAQRKLQRKKGLF